MENKFDYAAYNQAKQEYNDNFIQSIPKEDVIYLLLYAAHHSTNFSQQLDWYLSKHHGFNRDEQWDKESYYAFIQALSPQAIKDIASYSNNGIFNL